MYYKIDAASLFHFQHIHLQETTFYLNYIHIHVLTLFKVNISPSPSASLFHPLFLYPFENPLSPQSEKEQKDAIKYPLFLHFATISWTS